MAADNGQMSFRRGVMSLVILGQHRINTKIRIIQ